METQAADSRDLAETALDMSSTLKVEMRLLKERMESMESRSQLISEVSALVDDLKVEMGRATERISELQELCHSVALLAWNLDVSHRQDKSFVDIVVNAQTQQSLEEDRSIVRGSLSHRQSRNHAIKVIERL